MLQCREPLSFIGHIDCGNSISHGQRASYSPLGVVILTFGCAEHRQNGVPQKLVDRALVLKNNAGHMLKVAIEERYDFGRG